MPGIAGFFTRSALTDSALMLGPMIRPMLHEPAYAFGHCQFEEVGAGVGWVSQPGGGSACMPVWNERRDVCLVFVGEHFGDESEIHSLRIPGHSSPRHSANSLVRLYEQLGTGAFEKLNGWFSGVLVDLKHQKAFLFNDRFGLGRIYWCDRPDGLYFASEAKVLLKLFPDLRRLDHQSLAESFSCGCVLQNRSLYAGAQVLPAGSLWTISPGGRLTKGSYFNQQDWLSDERLSIRDFSKQTGEVLERVIPKYFSPGQRIGMSLTGGVDSRMIMAAAPCEPGSLPCYTFGGMLRDSADVLVSRQVATACGQEHRILRISPEFFERFPSLARESIWRTDGTMDVSGAVGLFMNELAREVAQVRMTGNYGGEVLRTLVHFKPRTEDSSIFSSDFIPLLDRASTTYAHEFAAVAPASFIAFRQVPWYHYGRFALEQSKLTVRTPYLDNEVVKLSFRAPPEAHIDKGPATAFIARMKPALAAIPTDRAGVGRLNWLPLRLRRFCTEFMPRLEYLYDYGMPHGFVRFDRMAGPLHIERLLLGRQKYTHFRMWYRDQLSAFVKAVLLDTQTLCRPYLNGRAVEKLVVSHLHGRSNYTTQIHQLLTSEMIERNLIVPI